MKKAPETQEPQEEYAGDFGGKPATEESGLHAAQAREAEPDAEGAKEAS